MYGLTNEEKLSKIRKFSKELGITAYDFGENTSISAVGARNILEGISKNPRTKTLNIMLEYLEDQQIGYNLEANSKKLPLLAEPSINLSTKKTDDKVVPYYKLELTDENFEDFNNAKDLIEYYINYMPLNDCTAYIPYYGESMFPMFKSGSTLAVKQIFNFDVILWGEAHLIVTNKNANNYKTVKCIHQHSDNNKIVLRSVNPNHPGDIVINKKDILSLFLVKGKIKLSEL